MTKVTIIEESDDGSSQKTLISLQMNDLPQSGDGISWIDKDGSNQVRIADRRIFLPTKTGDAYIDTEEVFLIVRSAFVGFPEDVPSLLADMRLLTEVKKRAALCKHADDACSLVYFINDNTQDSNAVWIHSTKDPNGVRNKL
jgi:hypothetical protein